MAGVYPRGVVFPQAVRFVGMPEWLVLTILAGAGFGVVGLAAVWAGLGKRPWLVRFGVLAGVLSIWPLIPAYDAALVS